MRGYGIVPDGGEVLMDTVGPTPRSAIVNWLFTYVSVAVTNRWNDGQIRYVWEHAREKHGVSLREVECVIGEEVEWKQ